MSFTENGLIFEDKEKTILMSYDPGYSFPENFEIPPSVKVIKSRAFDSFPSGPFHDDKINNFVIPSTVEKIESSAFQYLRADNVIFQNGSKLKKVEDYAFIMSRIKKVKLSDDIRKIGRSAFEGAKFLEEINLDNIEKYNDRALAETNIEDITFSDNVFYIGQSVLDGSNIKKITYASNCSIPREFCAHCVQLEEVNILSNPEEISFKAFYYCTNLKKINFNEGLKTIGMNAFEWTALSSIAFPSTLKNIWSKAFIDCRLLGDVSFLPGESLTIGANVFENDPIKYIYIPNTTLELHAHAFSWMPNLETIRIEADIDCIPAFCFTRCEKLENIFLPSSVTKIGAAAFKYTGIKEINEQFMHVETFDEYAFEGCHNLKKVFLFDKALLINPNLKNINPALLITPDLKKINPGFFKDCENIELIVCLNKQNEVIKEYPPKNARIYILKDKKFEHVQGDKEYISKDMEEAKKNYLELLSFKNASKVIEAANTVEESKKEHSDGIIF